MKKNIVIIFSVVLVVLLVAIAFTYFISQNKNQKNQIEDLSLVNNEEIINILKTDKDIESYTQKYSDFGISNKEILTKDSIIAGQSSENFQAVYSGLDLEDNRYMKVDLMNQAGSSGFVAVIDFKDKSVSKAFGILLFQASADAIQNGQKISIPAENK